MSTADQAPAGGFSLFRSARRRELEAQVTAIGRSQAVIEFAMDGTILRANRNFLDAVGYSAAEVQGQHHRMFVDPHERDSPEYREFWARLARGKFDSGQYRRLGKGGREVWIQASYNPVLGGDGRPFKVVKFAADITAQKLREAEVAGQLAAIDKSMAVIEFTLDGRILRANGNFLDAMGYTAAEVVGQHHRLFVEPAYAASEAYRTFWAKLARGEFDAGQYRRLGKGGREVWIEANYNPILDPSGRPFKVVKYATDITARKRQEAENSGRLAALDKVQAVIEFDLDGNILAANANFLACVGYTLEEIRGRHHRLFVLPAQRESAEYRAFWQRLGRGEADTGRYCRVGKDGRELWLRASYNPIFDADGKPYKVVKYATDVTAQVRLTDGLRAMVAEVEGYAERISGASREIASGNADLSARTEAQAASLEEAASAMHELTATVQRNADGARQASEVSRRAADVAGRGSAAMQSVVANMQEISASSRKIADIIGVIDGIAFQTNILALNAAVEAARAGDQGRGFAVVASEVRALAQRSAEAAKDIKQLIAQSGQAVAIGSGRVEEAGSTMDGILAAIGELDALVRQIANASAEQAEGIEQVGRTVERMDETTQQNAALVEQAAASAQALDTQAAALFRSVSTFVQANALGGAG